MSSRIRIMETSPNVKVELVTRRGETVLVEVARERYCELGLEREQQVHLRPQDASRFGGDYSI